MPRGQPANQPVHRGGRGREPGDPWPPTGLDRPPQRLEPFGDAPRIAEQHRGADERRCPGGHRPDLMPGAAVVADRHAVAAGLAAPRTEPPVRRERSKRQRVAGLLPALVVGVTQIMRRRRPPAACYRARAWTDMPLRPRPLGERPRRPHLAGAPPARIVPIAEVAGPRWATASLDTTERGARLPADLGQKPGVGTIHGGAAEVSLLGLPCLLVVAAAQTLRSRQAVTPSDRARCPRPGLPVGHGSAAPCPRGPPDRLAHSAVLRPVLAG